MDDNHFKILDNKSSLLSAHISGANRRYFTPTVFCTRYMFLKYNNPFALESPSSLESSQAVTRNKESLG